MLNFGKKKWLAFGVLLICVSSYLHLAHADDSSSPLLGNSLLQQIANNTNATMADLNALPSMTFSLLMMSQDWVYGTTPSKTISSVQSDLANYGYTDSQDTSSQLSIQPQILQNLFGQTPVTYANDIAYQTLLGILVQSPDPRLSSLPQGTVLDPAMNYISNAAGMGITHIIPDMKNWSGTDTDKTNYLNYYKTVTSIESFGLYVLSRQYADANNGHANLSAQQQLIADAGSSDFFAQIMKAPLGAVMREILMFDSQILLTLTQIAEAQKEMVEAQVMTNTVLISTNMTSEKLMLRKAIQQNSSGP